MTGTATCKSLINYGPSLTPDPRVVARAALCATASYSREPLAKSFISFEHLNFLNVLSAPNHEAEVGSGGRSRFREAVRRKMGMHRETQSQGLLVAAAQSFEERNEVEVYVAFRSVASWVDIFDDADCSQASLLGYGDNFEGEVKGKFHNGFSKHLTNHFPEVDDLYDYVHSDAITGGKNVARLIFCGHSLGGAISHLAMLSLFMKRLGPEDVPTGRYVSIGFGSPHIGDQRAAEFFNFDFPVGSVLFTLVHEDDPVPFLLHNFPTKIKGAMKATPQATEAMRKLTWELKKLGTINEMEEADSTDTTNLSCLPIGAFSTKSVPSNVNTTANVHQMIMDARLLVVEKQPKYAPIGRYLRLSERRNPLLNDQLAADLLTNMAITHITNKLALDSNSIKAHYMSVYMNHLCPKVDALQAAKSAPGLTIVPVEPVIKSAFLAIHGSDSAEIRVSGKNLGLITRGGWSLKIEEPAYSFSSSLSDFYEFDDSNLQAQKVCPPSNDSPGDDSHEYVLKMRVQLPEEVKDAALYKVSLNREKKVASVGLKLAATSFGRTVQSNVQLDPRSFLLEPHSPLLSSLRKAIEKLLVITDAFSNSNPTTRKIYESVLLGVKYGLPDHADVLARILLSDEPLHTKQEQLFTDFFIPVDKFLCEALIKVRKNGHLRRFKKSVAGYRNVIDFLAKFCKEPSKFPDEILTFESMVHWSGLTKEDKHKQTYETLEEKILNYMPTGLADELKSGGQGSTSFESSLSVKESVFAEKTSSDILRWLRVLFGLRLVQQAIEKVPMVALVGADDVSEDTMNHLFGVDESVTLQQKKNVHFVEDGSTKLFVVHYSDSDLPTPGCNNRLWHTKEKQLSVVKSFDLCILLIRSVADRAESEIREAFSNEFITNYRKRCAGALIDKGSSDRVKFCHMENIGDRPKADALNQCGILSKHEIFSKIKSLLKLSGPSRSTAAERAFTFEDLAESGRCEHRKFESFCSNSGFALLSGNLNCGGAGKMQSFIMDFQF
ncbi:hypothetical protein R1flu_010347 [Riccia fluitans]|uniref:Fungal lipase-type domain-containing protein n=1 Tax=Riccia fluitans TaxID=41844 RepID=A0ABD1Z4W6_9MARC